ncbi:MAG: hypothetical protein ACLQVD_08465 [Capsulimonadaceae bacterium]
MGGINVRPHRPPTRSGEPVVFTTLEDEVDVLQVTVSGDAVDSCRPSSWSPPPSSSRASSAAKAAPSPSPSNAPAP